MPIELRRIAFSRDEVAEAARDYCIKAGTAIAPGEPCEADLAAAPDALVTLRFAGGRAPVRLGEAHLLGALVLCCREHRIPLPRAAAKMVRVEGADIVLEIRVEGADAAPG